MGPLLAVFPHPDDETFTAGGLMAAAVERGMAVMLICATRGEAGESAIPDIAGTEELAAVRERELREAMRHLGVADVRFLGYRDSGMEGSPSADDPRAFVQVPVATAAARLAVEIRSTQPGLVVTFGQEGVYGHPDHIHLHHVVRHAVLDAADSAFAAVDGLHPWQTPALYYGTTPREDMLRLLDRPNGPLHQLSERARANLGTPMAEITHVLDTRRWSDRKLAALKAHYSQTGEGGPLTGIPTEILEDRLAKEYFVRADLPWSNDHGRTDFLSGLDSQTTAS